MLPKDIVQKLALELDLETVLNICRASKRMNQVICDSKIFWMNRIKKEYPQIEIQDVTDYKGLYKYLISKPRIVQDYFDDYEIISANEPYVKIPDLAEDYDLKKGDVVIFLDENWRRYIWLGSEEGDEGEEGEEGDEADEGDEGDEEGNDYFQVDYADDYFSGPTLFFPEFPLNYFHNIIDHDVLRVSHEYLKTHTDNRTITGKFGEKYPYTAYTELTNEEMGRNHLIWELENSYFIS